MSEEVVRLRALRKPLPRIELPSGRLAEVVPFNMAMSELWQAASELPPGPEQEAKYKAVVHLAIPSITPEEWGALEPEEALAIIALSRRKLHAVLEMMGNAEAPVAKAPRRRRSK